MATGVVRSPGQAPILSPKSLTSCTPTSRRILRVRQTGQSSQLTGLKLAIDPDGRLEPAYEVHRRYQNH